MKIEHIAMWVHDLEQMKSFYTKYFNMSCNELYENPKKQFTSYFLSFPSTETRLELMQRADIPEFSGKKGLFTGLTHLAISVGSKEAVDLLTDQMRNDGVEVVGEPRTTGDGYYESVILDYEGNHVEITV